MTHHNGDHDKARLTGKKCIACGHPQGGHGWGESDPDEPGSERGGVCSVGDCACAEFRE